MERHQFQPASLLGAICVSLTISLPVTASSATLRQTDILAQANPHPSIFNEPPYNRSTPATEPTTAPSSPLSPPLPDTQQAPSAVIVPQNGLVNVTLINQTGAIISYQAIGDTNQRSLAGKSSVVLQNLKTPITVTFHRQDSGLLKVTPEATSQPGLLSVTFTETTDLGTDRSAMRIQSNGFVLLN